MLDKHKLLYEFGIDLENRRLYMFGEVDDDNVEAIIKAIHMINEEENKDQPIELYLSTDGGSVELMFAMHDVIRNSTIPIHTIATGGVLSAGVLILACGHLRFSYENSWLMHHLTNLTSVSEDERSLQAIAKQTKAQSDRFYEILENYTKKPAKWWEEQAIKQGELWLPANEMLKVGLIDEIIKNPPVNKPKRRSRTKKK